MMFAPSESFGVEELAPQMFDSKLSDSMEYWRIKRAHEIHRAPL